MRLVGGIKCSTTTKMIIAGIFCLMYMQRIFMKWILSQMCPRLQKGKRKDNNFKDPHKENIKDEHQILILKLFSSLQIINMINCDFIITLSMWNKPLLQNLHLLSPKKKKKQ